MFGPPEVSVSVITHRAGDVVANLVPAAPNASGEVCVYLQQSGHIVIDQLGEFVP